MRTDLNQSLKLLVPVGDSRNMMMFGVGIGERETPPPQRSVRGRWRERESGREEVNELLVGRWRERDSGREEGTSC